MKRKRNCGVCIKIDFEKAYDMIDWGNINNVMERMNFGCRWISWISECLTSALIVVLVNGSTTEFFPIGHGVRQGDPLSHFVFNLAVERLSYLLEQAMAKGFIKWVCVGERIWINHLEFIDDTILFYQADEEEVLNVKRVLTCFHLLSDLKVNFLKTSLINCDTTLPIVYRLAALMQSKVENLPVTYLGLPLGTSSRCAITLESHLAKNQGKKWANGKPNTII